MKKLFTLALLTCSVAIGAQQLSYGEKVSENGEAKSFLTFSQSINSDFILPPPPAFDSVEFQADKVAYEKGIPLVGGERWKQAAIDADLNDENIGQSFSESFGIKISKENTPITYSILFKLIRDAGNYATKDAKEKYMRMRPFMFYNSPTCLPEDEEGLRKNGSYPSGHTALGWSTALVLAEIRPERANEILKRGYEYGQSRVICRAHWQSDVNAGRVVGAAQYANLHTNKGFLQALEQAKAEIAGVLAKKK